MNFSVCRECVQSTQSPTPVYPKVSCSTCHEYVISSKPRCSCEFPCPTKNSFCSKHQRDQVIIPQLRLPRSFKLQGGGSSNLCCVCFDEIFHEPVVAFQVDILNLSFEHRFYLEKRKALSCVMSLLLPAVHRNFNKRKKNTCFILHFFRRYNLLPSMRCSSSQNMAATDSTTFWRESQRSLWSNFNGILSIKARESSFLPEANLRVRFSCRNSRRGNHHLSCLHLSVLRVLQRKRT